MYFDDCIDFSDTMFTFKNLIISKIISKDIFLTQNGNVRYKCKSTIQQICVISKEPKGRHFLQNYRAFSFLHNLKNIVRGKLL